MNIMPEKQELLEGLHLHYLKPELFVFDSIDSTNNCLKLLADIGKGDGTVVIAEVQTEGRGRQGRSWQAEKGKNLLFSLLLRPPLTKRHGNLLTLYACVATALAVERLTNLTVEVKWPNDLLLNKKKFCGILLENSYQRQRLNHSVIGCGINVNQQKFSGEYTHKPTSLCLEIGHDINRVRLFQEILMTFDRMYAEVVEDDFSTTIKEWLVRCRMLGKKIKVEIDGEVVEGVALDIAPDGGLRFQTIDETRILYQAEVKIIEY
jgi:BirA family biotin operon repressor/biotin-[acetyl-CoA-carboxylase] ligase